ncbi:hypothetical protein LQW54_001732 [Pestalotiopsis sp. IQ-011]
MEVNMDKARLLRLYGADFLVAAELRNRIVKEFAVKVPVFELMSGKMIEAIWQLVARTSQGKRPTEG